MVAAFLAFATPAKAQLTLNVFVDPHRTVSGGTIGFAYAGDKFVGSVQGDGVGILYSTDLTGGNTQIFAPSISVPGGSVQGEHSVASSRGLAGFPKDDIYVAAGNSIVHITNDGSKHDVFSMGFPSPVRAILFDLVGTFGFRLLATTYEGEIYQIDQRGRFQRLASTNDDVEGMDIAPLGAGFGRFDGQLVVVGSNFGLIQAISASGIVTVLNPRNPIPGNPETITFVPPNLGASGSHLEGLYSANWPPNVLKADASQFLGLKGDAIIMSEVGDHRIYRFHWNGSAFEGTVIGRSPDQAEQGFFLTPAMLGFGGSCPPEGQETQRNSLCWPHCRIDPINHPRADIDGGRNPREELDRENP
jgi:hypothetical protein